jgi:hypothetical protein
MAWPSYIHMDVFCTCSTIWTGLLKFEAFVIEALPFLLHMTAFGAMYLVELLDGGWKERGPLLLSNPLCSLPSLSLVS